MLKAGDLGVIKDYESIKNAEYQGVGFNTEEMKEFCEKEAQIIYADKDYVGCSYYKLSVDQNNQNDYRGGYTWQENWITQVIEAPKGEKIMEEEKEYSEEEKKLIAEMIKKIDVKRFKKLLASSFQIPSTKLFGIEKILQKWAENKLELYKLLGNNISISREIEYNADERTWRENVQNLIRKFPRNRLYA